MTFKQWIINRYDESEIKNILSNGCVSGACHGATYYSETVALYDEYHSEIWSMLSEDAAFLGEGNALNMIASFHGADKVGSEAQFKNLLVWYYIETIANHAINGRSDTNVDEIRCGYAVDNHMSHEDDAMEHYRAYVNLYPESPGVSLRDFKKYIAFLKRKDKEKEKNE